MVDAKGHIEGESVQENYVDPTCTEAGGYDMVVYCTVCDEELSRTHHTIDALGHAEGEIVPENDVAPTCEGIGSYDMVVYCTVYQAELSRTTHTVDPIGHDWDNGEITTDPTCTEKGIKTFTCKNDAEHTYTEAVDALGHTPADAVKESCIDSTCVEDGGYDLVVYCSVCNSELSRTHHITDATGHEEGEAVEENYIAATCTEAGSYDMVVYCTVCQKVISKTSHTLEAIGHNYESVTTDATCTEKGYVTHTCKNCGDSYQDAWVDALGHTEGEAVKKNEITATCTEKGGYDLVTCCTKCNTELSNKSVVLDATGHNMEAGVCKNCGYIEEIPKTGDVDGYWLAVAILMTTASLVVLLLNNKKRMEF